MFIIKWGGANKVLIDNKPPADRLNLTEIEAIIRDRAKLPIYNYNYDLVARKNDTYYIDHRNDIYKGNPYKEWTIISKKIDGIVGPGEYQSVKINDDDSLDIVFATRDTYGSAFWIIKLKDNYATLVKKDYIDRNLDNIFILNNDIYAINSEKRIFKISDNGNVKTEITNGINYEDGTDIRMLSSINSQATYNGKRYISTISGRKIKFIEFDGERLRVAKEIDNTIDAKYIYSERMKAANIDEMYFCAVSETIQENKLKKFQLINKKFDITKNGETSFPMVDFLINKNQEYIVKEAEGTKCTTLVEFPVKAYVRRE